MVAPFVVTPSLLGLTAAAAASAWKPTGSVDRERPVRLALSFVVAAAISLQAPQSLVVAVVALGVSRGAGLAGALGPGTRAAIAGICGALAAAASGSALSALALPPLAGAAIVTAAMSGTVLLLEWTMGASHSLFRETLQALANVAAAALLASSVRQSDLAALLCAATLVGVTAHALRASTGALAEAAWLRAVIASRESELATIQAIGRDVVATVDADRIFGIIERECRKIFAVDFFLVGVVDRDTNEILVSYRSRSDATLRQTLRPLRDDLTSWIVREKRPLRIDDAQSAARALPFRPHVVDARIRSVLAAPLLVGERLIGVLSVQCERPAAYDDHQLAVLATMAQQVAVAVEHARQRQSATIDSLTRLSLRDELFRRLEEESVRARRYAGAFSLLMLDLDGFKEINDRHGHIAGDQLLREVGAVIKARMRAADVACRYGGDEFCVLLPATNLASARPIAERLRQTLSRVVVEFEGATLRTTVSIGIASYPEHDAGEINNLLLRADAALYRAKRAGRDRVVPYAA